ATLHVVKDDAIFDKYLEKPDDELEPRKPRDGEVVMFIDLEATHEDPKEFETRNEEDVTMQTRKQRGALPLIRKFNEHSERLLKSAMCVLPCSDVMCKAQTRFMACWRHTWSQSTFRLTLVHYLLQSARRLIWAIYTT
ncbi:hypothetical protein EDB83DRAFT_2229356, partial [Lactarius deliciosus]